MAAGDVCAVVVEPIQGEGGVRALSPTMIAALYELTERHGALLVADEVQTGLGRSGRFLASATWPRRPDVVLLAKTLGGGLMPISVMLTHRAPFERAYGKSEPTTTAAGTSASCSTSTGSSEPVRWRYCAVALDHGISSHAIG